jgi:hypothetical protein
VGLLAMGKSLQILLFTKTLDVRKGHRLGRYCHELNFRGELNLVWV